MQNIAVDVEVNLQIRREKLKAKEEEKKNITEVKLSLLVRKLDERIHKITMKDEFFVQNHHEEIEEVDSHEQIPLNSNYHRSKNEFTDQYEEEESADLMCMMTFLLSMIFLKNTTSIFLDLMEKMVSLPKNIFKVLRIIWIYLRLMKMMLKSDFLLFLCKIE